jgi:hypothetical protein
MPCGLAPTIRWKRAPLKAAQIFTISERFQMRNEVMKRWHWLIAVQRRVADQSEPAFIDQARRQGWSWQRIADVLGLPDAEAAEQRRGPRCRADSHPPEQPPPAVARMGSERGSPLVMVLPATNQRKVSKPAVTTRDDVDGHPEHVVDHFHDEWDRQQGSRPAGPQWTALVIGYPGLERCRGHVALGTQAAA